MEGERKQAIQSLALTILLGFYFTFLQAIEYYEAPFTIADGVYGSTFFVATGFHGLHVIIGSSEYTLLGVQRTRIDVDKELGLLLRLGQRM